MIRQLWDSDAHGSFHESGSMFDFRAGGLSLNYDVPSDIARNILDITFHT